MIDPVLEYSTYLGGTDEANAVATDAVGDAYLTGSTYSPVFPIAPDVAAGPLSGQYVFVAKLNPEGAALVYSAYFGGSSSDDGRGIAVDGQGNAYVTGATTSSDFPIIGALQSALAGYENVFIAKLNATGSALDYSTYLGGSYSDLGNGIVVDVYGAAYVTGSASSLDFPVTLGSLQSTQTIDFGSFAAKLNPDGASLAYSTYLGGSSGATSYGIAVDAVGEAYLVGDSGPRFPVTPGAFQGAVGGVDDLNAFVAKLNSTGSTLVFATYIGGSTGDRGYGIALDKEGDSYVTGQSSSSDFPITAGSAEGERGSAFVSELNSSGSTLVYSTHLGGSVFDQGQSIALDQDGNAYVTGFTESADFPVTVGAEQTQYGGGDGTGGDAFVTEINAAGSELLYSTYLGGHGDDTGFGIAIDPRDDVFVAGGTTSVNIPTRHALQSALGEYGSAFLAKFAGTSTVYSVTPGSSQNGAISPAAAQVVEYGASRQFTSEPVAGYALSGWIVDALHLTGTSTLDDGTIVTVIGTTIVFSTIQGSHTIGATFAPVGTLPVVTNTGDSAAVGSGSLRAAILFANNSPGTTITFQAGLSGSIVLTSDLPGNYRKYNNSR